MREVVTRRYRRLREEQTPLPGLVLIDGGIGQLHAAAEALESLGIINQPMAAIAKREETIYVLGQENEPVQLERFSPVLHLIQMIRDESHRFAVRFHRQRRDSSRLTSELLQITGIGEKTARKLLREFGSLDRIRASSVEDLSTVVNHGQARRIHEFLAGQTVVS
jgi:excinuclease ABC subunit C